MYFYTHFYNYTFLQTFNTEKSFHDIVSMIQRDSERMNVKQRHDTISQTDAKTINNNVFPSKLIMIRTAYAFSEITSLAVNAHTDFNNSNIYTPLSVPVAV